MKDINIEKAYEAAKERYSAIGVDTDKAMETLAVQHTFKNVR